MLFDVFDQAILVMPHFEEVVAFAELFHWAIAVGAEATGDIFLRPKPLIECAVPSNIITSINQLLIIKLLKVLLND